MTNIELPTYKTLVTNEVFGRVASQVVDEPATELLILTLTTIPTEEEVIDFIRTSAQTVVAGTSEDKHEVVSYLKSLPEKEIKGLAEGNERSLNRLTNRYEYEGFGLQVGATYLEAQTGIISNQLLKEADACLEPNGTKMYQTISEQASLELWRLRIKLENGSLPDKSDLEFLLGKGVLSSDVLDVEGYCKDYKNAVEQTARLYEALSTPEMIAKLMNTHSEHLDMSATVLLQEGFGRMRVIIPSSLDGPSEAPRSIYHHPLFLN